MEIDLGQIILNKISVIIKPARNKEPILAFVELIFNDYFKVRGYTIKWKKFKGNAPKLILDAPAFRLRGGKFMKSFIFENKREWKKVEKKILDYYTLEFGVSGYEDPDEINIDDIPDDLGT